MTRDEHGRFVKGHPKMGGRLPRQKEAMYYNILISAVSADDWAQIIQRAVSDAKKGDGVARKWLADYIIGVPQQKVDVTSGGDKILVTLKDQDG